MANKNRAAHRIAVLDFETDPFVFGREPLPFAGGIFDGEYYQQFWGDDCHERVAEYIKDELQGYTIYAHNGGKFDFFFLIPWLDENIKIINGRIAICSIGSAILTDSYLLLPMPLSVHKKDEIDYNIFEHDKREIPKNKKAILAYLKSDCLYLHEWVSKFINRFGKRLTVAGTAFNELKKTGYGPKPTAIYYDDIFRPFYFGGRVQTFQTGEILGPHTYIDINSAYSYSMLLEHPYGADYYEKKKIPNSDNGAYFAEIEAVNYGALPFRDLDDNKLYFYNDDTPRIYRATGWEIIAGLQTETLKIKKVKRLYQHKQFKDFQPYVYKFFEEKTAAKKANDKDNEIFSKLMLNSCYGKFGQDGRQFKDFCLTPINCLPEDFEQINDDDENPLYNWQLHCIHETGYRIWEKPAPLDRFYNVATAASITGFVRAYLWQAICASDSPVYCDTDSIMCKKFNGVLGNDLGQWKIEANLDQIYIGGRKFYAVRDADTLEYKTACKGARLTAQEIINEVKNGGGFIWKKDAPAYSLKYGARFLERKISRQFN